MSHNPALIGGFDAAINGRERRLILFLENGGAVVIQARFFHFFHNLTVARIRIRKQIVLV